MQHTAFLQLHNLDFAFDTLSKKFFNHLSATFDAESITFIQGRNGVGKSTLFRILSGDLHSRETLTGTLVIAGKPIICNNSATYRAVIKKHIRVVQQNVSRMLADQFSVKENLQAALFNQYPGLNGLPQELRYLDLLASFGVRLDKAVSLLSGGQKQILAIIMVLQKHAPILLLDEPTAALDPQNTHFVMNFLNILRTTLKLTILIINHDQEVLATYAPHGHVELYVQDDDTRNLRYRT